MSDPRHRRRRGSRRDRCGVVERNSRTYLPRAGPVFLSGFVEPLFYLFSIGVGVGSLVRRSSRARTARSSTTSSSRRG